MTFEERIWNHIVRIHGDRIVLTVSDLERTLGQEKQATERHLLVTFLKKCGARKVGTFVAGRRGKPSRIQWVRIPKSLASADVLGSGLSNGAATTVRTVAQEIPIRAGVVAKLVVPEDLSTSEAERIADFIRRLPIAV